MRAADPTAARAFYSEAIALAEGHCEGQTVPAAEVAKLHANRCAALLAMARPGEALADARRAAALAPTWSKACYRLGGVLHQLGRLSAAKTALRRAAALAAEGGEGGGGGGGGGGAAAAAEMRARLEVVTRELAAQIEARAQRKAAAGAAAASGDWQGACDAYTALVDEAEAAKAVVAAEAAAAGGGQSSDDDTEDEEEGEEEEGGGAQEEEEGEAEAEGEGAPPALYANRAACLLRLGRLGPCVADCDAALAPRPGPRAGGRAGSRGGKRGRKPADSADHGVPERLRWKLLVRRAEAHRRLGRAEAAARDLDAAARLLRHDAEAAAVLEQLRSGLHDAAL